MRAAAPHDRDLLARYFASLTMKGCSAKRSIRRRSVDTGPMAANVLRPAISTIALIVGFPAPWPARVSTLRILGLSPGFAAWSAAIYLRLRADTMRSSVSAVVTGLGRIGRARADRVIRRTGQENAEVGFLPRIAVVRST